MPYTAKNPQVQGKVYVLMGAQGSTVAKFSLDEIAEAFCALLIPAHPTAGQSLCVDETGQHAFHAKLLRLLNLTFLPHESRSRGFHVSWKEVFTTQIWLQVWQCLCSVQAVLGFNWLLVAAWRPPWQALRHVCVHSDTGWWPGSHCVFRYLPNTMQACCECLILVFLQLIALRTISSSRAHLNHCLCKSVSF